MKTRNFGVKVKPYPKFVVTISLQANARIMRCIPIVNAKKPVSSAGIFHL